MLANRLNKQFSIFSRYFNTSWNSYKFLKIAENSNNNVLTVHLNRPKLHNAFNEQFIAEITDIFANVSSKYRAIVLTGEGKSFSAGADLNYMKKMINYNKNDNIRDALKLYEMFYSIYTCPVVTIARVNGNTMGGGTGLISACDIALSVENANIAFSEVRLGIIPAVISKFVLLKIGFSNAKRYFLTGQRFNGKIAKQIGLVNDYFKDISDLDKEIDKIIAELKLSSPNAVIESKKLIDKVWPLPTVEDSKTIVATLIAELRTSEQGQEGLKAFLEKRKPNWSI